MAGAALRMPAALLAVAIMQNLVLQVGAGVLLVHTGEDGDAQLILHSGADGGAGVRRNGRR